MSEMFVNKVEREVNSIRPTYLGNFRKYGSKGTDENT